MVRLGLIWLGSGLTDWDGPRTSSTKAGFGYGRMWLRFLVLRTWYGPGKVSVCGLADEMVNSLIDLLGSRCIGAREAVWLYGIMVAKDRWLIGS